MIYFENEGVYITPEGYFISKWNPKKRKYESCSIDIPEIMTHLNSSVFLTENVRLKDILTPLINAPMFEIIFHTDWWKDLMLELKTKEWKPWIGDYKLKKDIDGDEIEYLEIYQVFDFSKNSQTFNYSSLWQFHGIGYPFIDSNKAQESFKKVGERQQYALEFLSITELMNIPFKIGSTIILDEDVEINKDNKIISTDDNYLTLYELIRSIVYEMSFLGVGEEKEDFTENLSSSIEEIKENPHCVTSYSTSNVEDFFEEIKLQNQEEETLRSIDKLYYTLSEIENKELFEKMKMVIQSKFNL